jgi:type I restriction enzyme R subunit
MDEDPALYMKLSEMINEAIRDHRKKRLDDQEYLNKVTAVMDEFRGATEPPSIPESIRDNQSARAFFGLIEETEKLSSLDQDQWAKAALKVDEIIENHKVRDFEHNQDVQNKMLNDLDDYFYSLKGRFDLDLTAVDLDYLLERIMRVAIRRAEL